mmetsp:Transcript_25042/g.38593  ORF Transcript_25042/g.38593 Transcript_25042/m.38593 type:complete len:441 (-) Transcript_25042:52-1374(-)
MMKPTFLSLVSFVVIGVMSTTTTTQGFTVAPLRTSTKTLSTSTSTTMLRTLTTTQMSNNNNNNNNENDESGDKDAEAQRMQSKAEELREQIRKMEEELGESRPRNYEIPPPPPVQEEPQEDDDTMSLRNKRILVVGANGRLGSMVCRYLLRNHPEVQEIVAAVHYVGENSSTSRGYGRLSYEVGAEDGVGTIGAAWSSAEYRVATFQYSDEMKDYNLQNLRLVEVELLDPVQCMTITEGVDSVIWCATDFNGNKPRAVSGLNVAFLFRAVADPTKGRVEVEGLRNMLGALKQNKQNRQWQGVSSSSSSNQDTASDNESNNNRKKGHPIEFVHVSTTPEAYKDFETPFGTFNGLKREGDQMVKEEFPSLSHTTLQFGKFEDNFVEESLDIRLTDPDTDTEQDPLEKSRRKINRRDAARAAAEALTNEELVDKTVQVWTQLR